MRKLILACLLLVSCMKHEAGHEVTDSAVTTEAVRKLEGKHMTSKRGPADVLGDTMRNQRRPEMVGRVKN